MTGHSIREAGPDDLDVIVEFNARLAHESEGKLLDRATLARGVAAALRDPDRLRYWVAEVPASAGISATSRIIGQAATTREWSDWRDGWVWWFQSVYVHDEHRGQGIFRSIHRRIRDLALATPDVIGLRLYVETSNDQARRVYEGLGMKPGGYDVYEELWLTHRPAGSSPASA